MKEDKIYLINKIFNSNSIRTIWSKEEEKYYISIIDIVEVLSDSDNPRKYWNKLKQRLKKEESEVVTICHQLKLRASDGKNRLTDVIDIEGMFRIIESIPNKNAEPIKQWLAKLGSDRINETFDPSIAIQRAINLYRLKGYDETWINKRTKTLQQRKELTDAWKEVGIMNHSEYAILTNEIYKTWSGMTAKEYKEFKNLRKENLRDHMNNLELILTDLSEETTKRLVDKHKPLGLKENIKISHIGGNVAKKTKEELENVLEDNVITSVNQLKYTYNNYDNHNKL